MLFALSQRNQLLSCQVRCLAGSRRTEDETYLFGKVGLQVVVGGEIQACIALFQRIQQKRRLCRNGFSFNDLRIVDILHSRQDMYLRPQTERHHAHALDDRLDDRTAGDADCQPLIHLFLKPLRNGIRRCAEDEHVFSARLTFHLRERHRRLTLFFVIHPTFPHFKLKSRHEPGVRILFCFHRRILQFGLYPQLVYLRLNLLSQFFRTLFKIDRLRLHRI